jgi:hypothetical protein
VRSSIEIEKGQRQVCLQQSAEYTPSRSDSILGFARSTEGKMPINGLRHLVTQGTSGWFIWCGESFSEAAEFFQPIHTVHIYEKLPEVSNFLGLPPGYRFLKAGDYLDIWYDPALL